MTGRLSSISAIIPTELLAIISSHLFLTSPGVSKESLSIGTVALDSQPTVFEVPAPFTLDRFILSHSVHHFNPLIPNNLPPPPVSAEAPPMPHLRTRSRVTEALQAAINSGIKHDSPTHSQRETEPHALFHSNGSSVSLSISLKSIAPQPLNRTISEPGLENGTVVEPMDLPSEATSETGPPTNAELQADAELPSLGTTASPVQPITAAPSFLLGNLFLSSCPGKKGMFSILNLMCMCSFLEQSVYKALLKAVLPYGETSSLTFNE